MMKSLFHWKVLLNLVLAGLVLVAMVYGTFRWLEVHTSHGKEIPVPNVQNLSVHKAIEVLEDAGLHYEVDSFNYDPKYKSFQVLQIYPSPGSRVKGGRAILLKVNPKTWAPVQVPDILDKYKGLAFRQLESVGLHVGDTIYEPNIQRDAVIRMQFDGSIIKPGTLLPRFSSIDLVIGTGPKRNVTVPNLLGLTVKEAKAIITNNLFEVGLIEHEDGGEDESDIIFYQDPEGGAIRDQGMQIDLWASKKNLAELQNKIKELNNIYRPYTRTDSLTSSRFQEETFVKRELPSLSESERASPEPKEKPVNKEPKPNKENTSLERKTSSLVPESKESKKDNGTKESKTKRNSVKPSVSEKPKAESQPKAKKVIVE